ncbi:MAG: stage V sporulation protein AC [Ruminococcaceae bacterium]|nr:stage V sporulation protein AC [Oscillospiraceae bacterium]
MEGKVYKRYVQGRAKKSPIIKDTVNAFLIGGTICTVGEGLRQMYTAIGLTEENVGTMTSATLIFITALLTGLGVFDSIAKRAGGGTLVPITGFANAVTAAAIDNKSEGFILGVGGQIFRIAGPVIIFGISSGVLYGVIYWILKMF